MPVANGCPVITLFLFFWHQPGQVSSHRATANVTARASQSVRFSKPASNKTPRHAAHHPNQKAQATPPRAASPKTDMHTTSASPAPRPTSFVLHRNQKRSFPVSRSSFNRRRPPPCPSSLSPPPSSLSPHPPHTEPPRRITPPHQMSPSSPHQSASSAPAPAPAVRRQSWSGSTKRCTPWP
jgi:hypothetical protein